MALCLEQAAPNSQQRLAKGLPWKVHATALGEECGAAWISPALALNCPRKVLRVPLRALWIERLLS